MYNNYRYKCLIIALTLFYFHWIEVLNLPDGDARQFPNILREELTVVEVRSLEELVPTFLFDGGIRRGHVIRDHLHRCTC